MSSELKEDTAPTNSIANGTIDREPVVRTKPKVRRRKFEEIVIAKVKK